MNDDVASIRASLLAIDKKLTAEANRHTEEAKSVMAEYQAKGRVRQVEHLKKAKAATAESKRVRRAMAELDANAAEKPCIKKTEFLATCFKLLAENGGSLPAIDLIDLAKAHFSDKGFSLAGLDIHVGRYLANDHRWTISEDGTASLVSTPPVELPER